MSDFATESAIGCSLAGHRWIGWNGSSRVFVIGTQSAMALDVEDVKIREQLESSERGSVLMEYVLVQVLVACLLAAVMNALFYDWSSGTFGPAGLGVKSFYQRLLGGLSLPVP